MAGFTTTKTKTNNKQLINEYLKTNGFLNRFGKGTYPLCVEMERQNWNERYIGRNDDDLIDIDKLFTPHAYEEKGEEWTPDWVADTHKHQTNTYSHMSGYWGLMATYDTRWGMWDFTFMIKVGDIYMFHPKAIYQRIVRQHGVEVYEKWKKEVMADWDNLLHVKNSWELPKPVVASIACSSSSERLCKKLGMEVRNGVVLWTKD